MTTDAFTDRLSEYLDGELRADERASLEAHLASCGECRAVLDELRGVIAQTSSLEDSPPARDLWGGIAARIAPASASRATVLRRALLRRRFTFSLPQLAAAGLALMLLSGGLVWMARSGDPRADFQPISAEESRAVVTPGSSADAQFDAAVADLQRTLHADGTALDAEAVRAIDDGLAAIDLAIDQSRRALAADPSSVYLSRHLAEARQQKLTLLRRANALMNAGH
jgi:anti-sigma factor RsiW